MTMCDHALAYAARGWAVFPLQAGGKLPLTPHGFKDATTNPETIGVWWKRWPAANIGVATGAASNIVVVDIDGPRGAESFEAVVQEHGGAPDTLTSRTGGGGYHLIFEAGPEPIRNTQSTIGAGIDTRGDGGYIVAPPSIHPSGAAYEWITDNMPAPLPDWLRPERFKPTPAAVTPAPAPRITPPADDCIDRARAYLAAMPAAVQGAAGHNALLAAASAMVHGFDLAPADALRLLWSEFNPRCSPPWNEADPKDRRDFERKVREADRLAHTHPRGHLRDAGGLPDDPAALEHGAAVIASILHHRQAATPTPAVAMPTPTKRAEPPAWPDRILQPPGDLGRLVSWINSTAWKKQPRLALANALAFAGALMGRKVKTETDLRTNIYAVGVAYSGYGKDHSRRAIKNLAAAAGIADKLLGGEDVSSDAAILRAVKRSPSCLFQFDEIGHMLAAVKSANAATYTRAIPVMLTKLYSSANSLFLGKEYADQEREREDIEQPNACLYGTTVPSTLYAGLTPADIRDGFLGRILIFRADDEEPIETDAIPTPPPEALVAWVRAWWERAEGAGNLSGHTARPEPIVVPMQADAKSVIADFRELCRQERDKARAEDEGAHALWSRAEENARKLALIYACAADFDGAVIGREAMTWAVELVRILMVDLIASIGQNVAETPHEAAQKRILSIITEKDGASLTEINRHMRKIKPKDRAEALSDLVNAGRVALVTRSTRGRPAAVYQIVA